MFDCVVKHFESPSEINERKCLLKYSTLKMYFEI